MSESSKQAQKQPVGRPPSHDYTKMPEPIPDTLENIARAVLNTPPKKEDEWEYLGDGNGTGK